MHQAKLHLSLHCIRKGAYMSVRTVTTQEWLGPPEKIEEAGLQL